MNADQEDPILDDEEREPLFHRASHADAEGGDGSERMPLEASEDESNAKQEGMQGGLPL